MIIHITGLGAIAVHLCKNNEEVSLLSKQYCSISSLLSRAILVQRSTKQSVKVSGVFLSKDGDKIPLYTGGAIDNPAESIYSSFAIMNSVYDATDFALR